MLFLAQGTPSIERRMAHSWQSPETAKFCRSHTWFTKRQLKLCHLHPDLIGSVTQGAMAGIFECRYQFRSHRWNCPISNVTAVFGKNKLRTRNVEMAFLQSMVSAGIMYEITKACGTGTILECGCDRHFGEDNPDVEWKWGGCSDNVRYGTHFTRMFIDESKKKKTAADMMSLHNYEAGRKAIERNMFIKCKCHGVSGSCTSKVCWNSMPKLRQVSSTLKKSYLHAFHMMYSKRSMKLRPIQERNTNPSKSDMVYLTLSPDYCEPNKRHGSLGTHGRRCNKTSIGVNGCPLMCCGRGYQTMLRHVTESCRCRFQWCCEVECETCERKEELHVCN
ncbi:protein Wnt-7b-like [Diadema setosum]|uniref:protein Wnt-7b-like n=1 Tax=Diadema setosum TaxID=31175 RepID=UPI003B3A04E3